MTSWMKERDRLVEQTLAFVQGVAAQRPTPVVTDETAIVTEAALATKPSSVTKPSPAMRSAPAIQVGSLAVASAISEIVSETVAPAQPKAETDQSEADALFSLIALSMPVQRNDLSLLASRPIVAAVPPPIHAASRTGSPKPATKPAIKPIEMVLPERDVIAQRVARFRAGQQKLIQDREENYAAVQARIRATLGDEPSS